MDSEPRPERSAESWRRIARLGATACCLATLIPTYSTVGSQWDMAIRSMLEASWPTVYQTAPNPKTVFIPVVTVITCFFQSALAAPVFFLFATGPWMLKISNTINVSKLVLFAQLALFGFVPASMLLRVLPTVDGWSYLDQAIDNKTILALGIAIFIAYLMLVGLSVLIWRDKRNTAWELTPLAAVPFFFCVLRWICMLVVSAQRGQPLIFQMTAVVYLSGALVLLIGWLQATRTLARDQLTTSPTASAPENHSAR